MIFDSARKALTSLTKRVTKKTTSKKKSKDVGTSKRRRKDDMIGSNPALERGWPDLHGSRS
jgi:hypothetical protein